MNVWQMDEREAILKERDPAEVNHNMTGRCATCKWWTDLDHDYWNEGRKLCALAECPNVDPHPFPNASALVFAREGGSLLTLPDHGCTQWESKG